MKRQQIFIKELMRLMPRASLDRHCETSCLILTLLRSNLVVKLHGAVFLCCGSGHRWGLRHNSCTQSRLTFNVISPLPLCPRKMNKPTFIFTLLPFRIISIFLFHRDELHLQLFSFKIQVNKFKMTSDRSNSHFL